MSPTAGVLRWRAIGSIVRVVFCVVSYFLCHRVSIALCVACFIQYFVLFCMVRHLQCCILQCAVFCIVRVGRIVWYALPVWFGFCGTVCRYGRRGLVLYVLLFVWYIWYGMVWYGILVVDMVWHWVG